MRACISSSNIRKAVKMPITNITGEENDAIADVVELAICAPASAGSVKFMLRHS